jgi:hypothetical protein
MLDREHASPIDIGGIRSQGRSSLIAKCKRAASTGAAAPVRSRVAADRLTRAPRIKRGASVVQPASPTMPT